MFSRKEGKMTTTINLKSDFELPAQHSSYRQEIGNMAIIAEADCLGKARKVCTDVQLALEHGAFPAAHKVMIHEIDEANRKGYPLACSLQFSL
jgi:hypothetical protein